MVIHFSTNEMKIEFNSEKQNRNSIWQVLVNSGSNITATAVLSLFHPCYLPWTHGEYLIRMSSPDTMLSETGHPFSGGYDPKTISEHGSLKNHQPRVYRVCKPVWRPENVHVPIQKRCCKIWPTLGHENGIRIWCSGFSFPYVIGGSQHVTRLKQQ